MHVPISKFIHLLGVCFGETLDLVLSLPNLLLSFKCNPQKKFREFEF